MKISSLLTLGILPAWKMLMGSNTGTPFRGAVWVLSMSKFGQPSEAKLKRVFYKMYSSKEEAEYAFGKFRSWCEVYCIDENHALELSKRLKKAGLKVERELIHSQGEMMVWDGTQLLTPAYYNYCNHCHRKAVRLYFEGDDDEGNMVYSCSSCGSEDTIVASELGSKEFERHVKKFESLPSHPADGAKKSTGNRRKTGTSQAVAFDDDD